MRTTRVGRALNSSSPALQRLRRLIYPGLGNTEPKNERRRATIFADHQARAVQIRKTL
jgi:hypothetical protein